jgi:predicted SnoaL-like aldol condensation-catalyzing enzyme
LLLREKRESIVLKHVAAENRHDVDASIATFHTPRYEVQPMGIVHDGKKAVAELLSGIFNGFPDFTVEIVKTHHSDDAVILEVRMKVTHQGEWAGLKLMGKTMNVPVACILISIKTD